MIQHYSIWEVQNKGSLLASPSPLTPGEGGGGGGGVGGQFSERVDMVFEIRTLFGVIYENTLGPE